MGLLCSLNIVSKRKETHTVRQDTLYVNPGIGRVV